MFGWLDAFGLEIHVSTLTKLIPTCTENKITAIIVWNMHELSDFQSEKVSMENKNEKLGQSDEFPPLWMSSPHPILTC